MGSILKVLLSRAAVISPKQLIFLKNKPQSLNHVSSSFLSGGSLVAQDPIKYPYLGKQKASWQHCDFFSLAKKNSVLKTYWQGSMFQSEHTV